MGSCQPSWKAWRTVPFQWIILGAERSKIEHFKLQGTLVAFKAGLQSHLKKTGYHSSSGPSPRGLTKASGKEERVSSYQAQELFKEELWPHPARWTPSDLHRGRGLLFMVSKASSGSWDMWSLGGFTECPCKRSSLIKQDLWSPFFKMGHCPECAEESRAE